MRHQWQAVTFAWMCLASAAASAAPYSFTPIVPPDFASGEGQIQINESGTISGGYIDKNQQNVGFVLQNDQYTVINPTGGTQTTVQGINSSGEIVGTSLVDNVLMAFTWLNGTYTLLSMPSANATFGVAVNDSGALLLSGSVSGDRSFVYAIYQNGVYTYLPRKCPEAQFLDNKNAVYGANKYYPNGFKYSNGKIQKLPIPGGDQTQIDDVSSSGEAAGSISSQTGISGFTLTGNTLTEYNAPGATDTELYVVGGTGRVAGVTNAGSVTQGFVVKGANYISLSVPNASSAFLPRGITSSGLVVGTLKESPYAPYLATPGK